MTRTTDELLAEQIYWTWNNAEHIVTVAADYSPVTLSSYMIPKDIVAKMVHKATLVTRKFMNSKQENYDYQSYLKFAYQAWSTSKNHHTPDEYYVFDGDAFMYVKDYIVTKNQYNTISQHIEDYKAANNGKEPTFKEYYEWAASGNPAFVADIKKDVKDSSDLDFDRMLAWDDSIKRYKKWATTDPTHDQSLNGTYSDYRYWDRHNDKLLEVTEEYFNNQYKRTIL